MSPTDRAPAGIRWTGLAALFVLVMLLYAPLRGHAFVDYDTDIYVTGNAWVRTGLSWDGVVWAFDGFHAANYHPLTWLSHMLDVQLFGLEPAGHLLHNAVLHALNACLLALLFRALGMGSVVAFGCALLFAVHPLRVEPVAWIAERKDLLASLFGFTALLLWVQGRQRNLLLRCWLAVLFLLFSLLSKPMFVTLPCVWMLLEYWPTKRAQPWWKLRSSDAPLFAGLALSVLFSALTVWAQAGYGAMQGLEARPLTDRIATALDAYRWYLASQFWPQGLAFHYPAPSWSVTGMCLRAALLFSLLTLLWRARIVLPWLTVGGLWFLGALVPVIGLVQVGAQAWADRFSYWPSVGLFLVFGLGWELIGANRLWTRLLAAALAVLLSLATRAQLETWRDTASMAQHALSVTGPNATAHIQLGIALGERGELDAAIEQLESAYALEPANPDAALNLGVLLLRKGDPARALPLLEKAVDLVPARALAWSHLGAAQLLSRQWDGALDSLDEALRLDPQFASAHANRAAVYEAQQRWAEARAGFETALRLKPESESARAGLVRSCLRRADELNAQGNRSAALDELDRAAEIAGSRPKLQQEIGKRRKEWGT